MNSFRFVERGIEAEIERQIADLGIRRHGQSGDAPLRSRQRLADRPALEGGGARLPLLPGAGPGAAGADRGDARARPGGASGAARRPARALRSPTTACRADVAGTLVQWEELGSFFEEALAAG